MSLIEEERCRSDRPRWETHDAEQAWRRGSAPFGRSLRAAAARLVRARRLRRR